MTSQSSLYKLFSCFSNYKSILNNSFRAVIAAPQPNAGFKQSSKAIDISDIPKKPQRPLTPYFRFLTEHRSLVSKEHPELSNTQIVKICAQDWKNIHETIKEKYSEAYKKEMESYSKEYLHYQDKLTPEQKEKLLEYRKEKIHEKKRRLIRKKNKETNKPKRPLGPYFLFLAEKAKERNEKYNSLLQILKDEWKNLSESEKQKYKDEFKKNIVVYNEEMRNWENQMIKDGHFDLVRNHALIERGLKTKPQYSKLAKRMKKNSIDDPSS